MLPFRQGTAKAHNNAQTKKKQTYIKATKTAIDLFKQNTGDIISIDPVGWNLSINPTGALGHALGVKRRLESMSTMEAMTTIDSTPAKKRTASMASSSSSTSAPQKKNSWWSDFKNGFRIGFKKVTSLMGVYDKVKSIPVIGDLVKAGVDLLGPEFQAGLDVISAVGEGLALMTGSDPDKIKKTVDKLGATFDQMGGNEMLNEVANRIVNEVDARVTPLIYEVDEYIAEMEANAQQYAPISLPRLKEYVPDYTQDIHDFIVDHAKEGGFKVATKGLQVFDSFINNSGDLSYSGHARDSGGSLRSRLPMSIGMTHAGGDLKGSGVPAPGSVSQQAMVKSIDTRYVMGNINSNVSKDFEQKIVVATEQANIPSIHQLSYNK